MKKVARHSYINGPEYVEVCDGCGTQSKACHSKFKELNRLNIEAGWEIRLKDKKWVGYCPDCMKKFMKEKNDVKSK